MQLAKWQIDTRRNGCHVAMSLSTSQKQPKWPINFNEVRDLITRFLMIMVTNSGLWRLKSYADPSDLAMLVSSSGASPNIVNAAKYARKTNLDLITFTGFRRDNELKRLGSVIWATVFHIM